MKLLRVSALAVGLCGSIMMATGAMLSLGGRIGPLQAAPLAAAAMPAVTAASMHGPITPASSRITAGPPGWAQSRGAPISHALAEQDIRHALARAEAIHPLLYWNASRMRVMARADDLIAGLPDQPVTMDVYVALSRIIGLLGDGHVSLSRPPGVEGDALSSYLMHGGRLLALKVRPTDGGLEILRSAVDGLRDADLVTTINGQSAWTLFARAAELASGEGGFKENQVEAEFAARLWDLGLRPPFALQGRFAGVRDAVVEVPGWASGSWGAQSMAGAAAASPEEGVHLTPLADGLMLLRIDRLTAPRGRFRDRLASVFTEIARSGTPGLILDIRQNGGGNAALDDDVLSYITAKPYRVFARVLVRASPECRAYLPGTIAGNGPARAIQTMADGEMKSWDMAVRPPLPMPNRFDGPVAVLIGPGTFSAANALANAIGDFRLAALVGRDTAEIPNNYGNACPVTLPNTGMTLRVPSAYMVRANGDAASHEDVHPDVRGAALGAEDSDNADIAAARTWIADQLTATTRVRVYRPGGQWSGVSGQ